MPTPATVPEGPSVPAVYPPPTQLTVDKMMKATFEVLVNVDAHFAAKKQKELFTALTVEDAEGRELERATFGRSRSTERERRAAVWDDAIRELSISNDHLYTFLRTMSGTLHEEVEAVVQLEDRSMEQSQKLIQAQRKRILEQTMTFQNRMIEAVLGSTLRKSNLQLDMSSQDRAAAGLADTLVVVNQAAVENVKELSSGASGMPFFTANAELEKVLTEQKGPVKLGDLVGELRKVVDTVQSGLMEQLEGQTADGARSSLEYLSRPRNSYLIRLKAETFAAIRTAYNSFSAEWRKKNSWYRVPLAWELVEGNDRELSDAFATYAAHTLANSRLFSSSQAAYLGVQPARANAIMLRTTLAKLMARAAEYVQRVRAPSLLLGSQMYTADVHRR